MYMKKAYIFFFSTWENCIISVNKKQSIALKGGFKP